MTLARAVTYGMAKPRPTQVGCCHPTKVRTLTDGAGLLSYTIQSRANLPSIQVAPHQSQLSPLGSNVQGGQVMRDLTCAALPFVESYMQGLYRAVSMVCSVCITRQTRRANANAYRPRNVS